MWRCRSLVLCSAARSVIFRKSSVLRVISAILGRAVSPSAISFYMFCPAAAEVERAGCCGTDGLSQSNTHTHTHTHTDTHTHTPRPTLSLSETRGCTMTCIDAGLSEQIGTRHAFARRHG